MGRGQLIFKGDDPKKKKKKSKHSSKKGKEKQDAEINDAADPSTVSSSSNVAAARLPQQSSTTTTATTTTTKTPQMMTCSGKITSSGTVITGHDGTKFEHEISSGDAIIVIIPETKQQEMRIVTMRLSNISLNISSSFSYNIKNPTSFQVIKKPKDEIKMKRLAQQKEKYNQKQEEIKASGTFGSTDELVYRERTEHGNYRIKRVKVQGQDNLSREDLLYMRTKKTSDKYC